MPPSSSFRLPASPPPTPTIHRWPRRLVPPLLVLFFAVTAGCQNRKSSTNRLPPEKELQPYSDEAPSKSIDPRRMSKEELETYDGTRALQNVEKNGVKIKE